MPESPEIASIELDYKSPVRGESYSRLPLNNTRALLRLAFGDDAVLDHDRSMEAAARMSSRSTPDIGVN